MIKETNGDGLEDIKVCFLIPEYVKDFYGKSAFILMHELSKFQSVVNSCDETCDIIFSTSFGCADKVKSLRKRYPNKLFVNYFWDLPFWRANDNEPQKKFLFLKEPSWKERYLSYLKSGDIIVSSSHHTKNEVMKYYGISTEVLYLYFPNIDIGETRYQDSGKKQVICVGRIEPYKRCDVLIQALSLTQDSYNLLLIGQGSERDRCLNLAKKLNVKVQSPGWLDRPETLKEIKASLLSVSPSVMEGNCGWCPCEAVWSGTPAIVADIPETREFFTDNILYFEKDNPHSLAIQIDSIMKMSAEERYKLVQSSKKEISFYTVDEGIRRLEDYIKKIAENRL